MPKARKQIVAVVPQRRKPKKRTTKVVRNSGMKSVIKSVGSSVGSLYGPLGARIGSHAADYISRIMGQGDYKVSKNTLLTNSGPPSFSTNGDDVIIKHREYVKDLSSSIAFANSNYLINPGNATLFPWLSQLATSFEEYEFLGLIVEYKSTSGSAIASTNNALGTVIIATDYNCSNANMTTKRAMETVEFSTSSGTDTNMIHPIECDKTRNVLARQYTTNATSIGGVADPKFHFLGNLQIAVVGQQANSITIGEMWVSYQVRLSRPVFSSLSVESGIPSAFYTHYLLTLGDYNCFPTTRNTINGHQVTLLTDGTTASKVVVPFTPQRTADTSETQPLMPLGLYQITWNFTMDNTGPSAGNLTYYAPGHYDPVVNLNGHASGLSVTLDDTLYFGYTSLSSMKYSEAPAFVTAGTVERWGGSARVYFNPSASDTSNSPMYFDCGRNQFSGTSDASYQVDVTCTFISDSNDILSEENLGKDELPAKSEQSRSRSTVTSDVTPTPPPTPSGSYVTVDNRHIENYMRLKSRL